MGDEAQLLQLSQCLTQSLNPDETLRKQAEAFLQTGFTQPGFSILLLRLLATESAEIQARQAAAVNFKNVVKAHWVQREADVVGAALPYAVSDGEKDQVRRARAVECAPAHYYTWSGCECSAAGGG